MTFQLLIHFGEPRRAGKVSYNKPVHWLEGIAWAGFIMFCSAGCATLMHHRDGLTIGLIASGLIALVRLGKVHKRTGWTPDRDDEVGGPIWTKKLGP